MRPRAASTAVVLSLLLAVGVGAATATFYESYERGVRLEQEGHWAEARTAFLAAVEQRPKAGRHVRTYGLNFLDVYDPYLHLVRVEIHLGLLDEAAAHLERARRAGVSSPAQLRRATRRLVAARRAAAASRMPSPAPATRAPLPPRTVTERPTPQATPTPAPAMLRVEASIPGATVTLDQQWIGQTPVTIPTTPGSHVVLVEAPGRAPYRTTVSTRRGQTARVSAVLGAPRRKAPAAHRTAPPVAPRVAPTRRVAPSPTPELTAASSPTPHPPAARPTAAVGRTKPKPRTTDHTTLWLGAGVALLLVVAFVLAIRRRASASRVADEEAVSPAIPTSVDMDSLTTRLLPRCEPLPEDAPHELGSYQLLGVLGRGGMATTYLGLRRRDRLPVAVKVPHPHILRDASSRERFLREGRLGATLHHPNIVRIFEAGQGGDRPFIAMELLEGQSLEDRIREGRLPLRETVEILRGIAEALDYAHMKGVVHRDLKPENIWITRKGVVKVMDYGIAHLTAQQGLTMDGTYLGTPYYSAPELVKGRFDHRSDLYSLGIILYRLLTGRLPFTGKTPFELFDQHRSEPLPPIPEELQLPRAVLDILKRLTAKDPQDRFPSAEKLLVSIRAVLNTL